MSLLFYFFIFKPGLLFLHNLVFSQGLGRGCVQTAWTNMASTSTNMANIADGSVWAGHCIQTQVMFMSALDFTFHQPLLHLFCACALLAKDV